MSCDPQPRAVASKVSRNPSSVNALAEQTINFRAERSAASPQAVTACRLAASSTTSIRMLASSPGSVSSRTDAGHHGFTALSGLSAMATNSTAWPGRCASSSATRRPMAPAPTRHSRDALRWATAVSISGLSTTSIRRSE
jgi:hypothetical protein